jgi:hypothetical protein
MRNRNQLETKDVYIVAAKHRKDETIRMSNKMKWVIKAIIVLLIGTLIFVWASSHISERVFHLGNVTYKLSEISGQTTTYQPTRGDEILSVTDHEAHKIVQIDEESYRIELENDTVDKIYHVTYPSGKLYKVVDLYGRGGMLTTYDEHGEMVMDLMIYVDDVRVLQDGEEKYLPASLVSAAYPIYHVPNGEMAYLILSMVLFVYGWCAFRFEGLQRVMFHISHRLWVQDPEPTDFYFFMSKVGGCIVMAFAVGLFFVSL